MEKAIARLDEAKLNYHASAVRTQPESIRLSNKKCRSTTEQIITLQSQLDKVDEELEQLKERLFSLSWEGSTGENTRTERAQY